MGPLWDAGAQPEPCRLVPSRHLLLGPVVLDLGLMALWVRPCALHVLPLVPSCLALADGLV